MISVKNLMSPANTVVDAGELLSQVLQLMQRNRNSCALVLEGGKVCGLVTERDLAGVMRRALQKGAVDDLPVREVMTPNPTFVRPETPLLDALKLARDLHVRHFPVLDEEGHLVGVITQTDMANAYIQILEQQTELVMTNQTLKAESLLDPLVAVGNRRAMDIDLKRMHARAKRDGSRFAVALLDLDWFKSYNDYYGHQAGDVALQTVARTIQEHLRQDDALYRYGGEEFLLLMPHTDLEGGWLGADRARAVVANLQKENVRSPLGWLTLSGGVASSDEADPQLLIAAADRAMYRAKSQGRNRVYKAEASAPVGASENLSAPRPSSLP